MIQKSFIVCIVFLVAACSPNYSYWATLGYLNKISTDDGQLKKEVYHPPLIELDNGFFVWIKPDSSHYIENRNMMCDGNFEGFIFYFWSINKETKWNIGESHILFGEKEINFSHLLRINGEELRLEGNLSVDSNDITTQDIKYLKEQLLEESFYPSLKFQESALRVDVKLESPVTCSINDANLSLRFSFGLKNVNLFPVVFKKLNR